MNASAGKVIGGVDLSWVMGARFRVGLDPGNGSYGAASFAAVVSAFLRVPDRELSVAEAARRARVASETVRKVCRDLVAVGHMGNRIAGVNAAGVALANGYRLTPRGVRFYRGLLEAQG